MPSLQIVVLDPKQNETNRQIVEWTRNHGKFTNDKDNIVAVDFNVGGFVRYSNSIGGKVVNRDTKNQTVIASDWDPEEDPEPWGGISQHTTFDGGALSQRDEVYWTTAVNWFVEFVLGNYLRSRTILINPTREVMAITGERTPSTTEEIVQLLCQNPDLLQNMRFFEDAFLPEQISVAVRKVVLSLLENREELEFYLREPEIYVAEKDSDHLLTDLEKRAFLRAAQEKGEQVLHAFDCVELGRGRGDGNVYVLIGWEKNGRLPSEQGQDWFRSQLPQFVEENGFVPGFGWYVTEARMRYHVVVGPGVTEREIDFLRFFGHKVIDRRDGQEIGNWREE